MGSADLKAQLTALRPLLAAAAQSVYDKWDASDKDYGDAEVGFGGICHLIVDAMADVVSGIPGAVTQSFSHSMGDVHVSLSVWDENQEDAEEGIDLYDVDINPHIYETGGGYNWQKVPDVKFEPSDVTFYHQIVTKEDLEYEG